MRVSNVLLAATLSMLLLICSPAVAGDRVILESGAVINGTIIMETPDLVVLELADVGNIRIPRDKIAEIKKDVVENHGSRVRRTRQPEAETRNSSLLRYEDLKKGAEVLLILIGEEHDHWGTSGQRHYCRVELVGPRRIKVSTSSKAGALGEIWVPRESVDRIVDVKQNPDFRIMLFDGATTGAWIRITTEDGSTVAGRLDQVTEDGMVSLMVPLDGQTRETAVDLGDIRSLQTIARKASLALEIASLEKGEPVAIHLWGHPDPISGNFAGKESGFLLIEGAPAADGSTKVLRIFKDSPITGIERLPENARKLLRGVARGDTVTVSTTTEMERSVVHRNTTGMLVGVSFDAVTIETGAERQSIPYGSVTAMAIPEESRLPALRGELDPAKVQQAPVVLPGMSEEEAKELLSQDHPGLDVIFADGLIVKVACRAPWSGSVFNLRIGGSLANASTVTDLVFDTQVDSKEGGFTTVESHSLKGLLVTLYVSADSKILGMEITRR